MPELLSEEDVSAQLSKCPEWERAGAVIGRELDFASFLDGIDFVQEVAELAEEANHHPDIDIRWRKVKLVLSTHSKGGLTELDFALAQKIDALL